MRFNSAVKNQLGQAIPVGLAFIIFGALLGIVVFNTGQLASEKTRVANTADAAVYSGLIWQARALNFQAYTNRAMVANQVAIAQMVSLTSWTNYGRISARNINNTIGWIPFLRPFTQAAETTMTQVENVVTGVAEVAVPVIDGVNQVLSQTQRAVYLATFAVTPAIVREVVRANDPRYSVDSTYSVASQAANIVEWQQFTRRYEDIDSLQRKADVINRSKDAFTRDRGWRVGRIYLAPVLRVRLIKEGTTNLVYSEDDDEWMWKGKDNLSLHVETFRCSWRGCRWRNNELPIGWGGAYVENDIDCDGGGFFRNCPRWMRYNRRGERLSDAEAVQINGNYSGVQAYYDLRDLSEDNQDPRLNLRLEVQLPQGGIRTSTNVDGIGSPQPTSAQLQETREEGLGRGVFWADDEMAASTMASMSTGEIFFERPTYRDDYQLRVNGRVQREYGSLFNPYWQVRLTPTSRTQRLAAWGLRSGELIGASGSGALSAAERYAQQLENEAQLVLQNFTGGNP